MTAALAARTSSRSPWLRTLPPVVVTEVRRRRGELLAGARGRLLDLDTPGALAVVEAAASGGDGELEPDERYDTVISTCGLIEVPDLFRAATGMARLLAPDGDLLLVEPVARPGTSGLLAASAGSLLPATARLHLGRDVVATVRATGLTVVDLDRFTIPTLVWPFRRFISARATLVVGEAA